MGAWIEIRFVISNLTTTLSSHPTMGAWIEISSIKLLMISVSVAPHDGCVD